MAETIDEITSSGAEVVFNTIVPPGLTPFLEQLHDVRLHEAGWTHHLHLLRRELPEPGAGRSTSRVCTAASTTTRTSAIRSARNCSIEYDKLFPGSAKFTAGSACSGMYRGLKLWEAAVKEAGSLEQDDVIRALDHAKIADGPGGPAEMVPGQHHVRMNMYIAQANNGEFKIVKSLGVVEPKERVQV